MGKGDRKTKRGKLFLGSKGIKTKKKSLNMPVKPPTPPVVQEEKKPKKTKKKE
jgi:ribosomal small subunit protein bTHX